MLPRPTGLVTLLSDFGLHDPYVGVMKGALLRAAAKVQIVDVAHELPPQDVDVGAFFVGALVGRFPAGTVHVAVVDPGFGTDRRLLAVAAHECYWLAPDNGLLATVLAGDAAIDVRALDAAQLGIAPASRTFHGRDILAPVAAWLATGRYGFAALGPRVADPVLRAPDATPRVVHVDRYGNLITNVPAAAFAHAHGVRIAGRLVARHDTYGDVRTAELLAYVGSFGLVEVAQNGGSAAKALETGRGAPIAVVSS
ncbi:MAG: SAM-dependent chlorinase/fluorinase [Pirellulales bacterium]